MKKILILSGILIFIAGTSAFTQNDKSVVSPKKATTEKVINTGNVSPDKASTDKAAPQTTPSTVRPKLSKEDSLKRVHKIDSMRKVIADRRLKEGPPKLSKEDSLKRAHRIDSLKRVARERKGQMQNGPQPYKPRLSKEDSLKKARTMDSLRKASESRQGRPTGTPKKEVRK
jgi:hypothetical protein